ncbi:MAG TPA: TIGR00730 family Rossman fold protein [Acetobacteraceae bacterium]|nr:TIGR00730 family Rossman fold protein [Acetobacteraceae bacterium]
MPDIHTVAVFCGSATGADPAFIEAAEILGRGLAEAGIRLVYGGGRVGMMGAVADAVLRAGGEVVGVIPDFLTRAEVAHDGLTHLIVTDSMHTRKRRMFDMSDAFVVLPGGLGTLDETAEIVTWRQLKLHDKPIVLCDVAGSAQPFVAAMETAIAQGFARPEVRRLFEVVAGPEAVLRRLTRLPAGEAVSATPL